MRSLKIGISPGRKKVSQGKPTEKRVIFIRTGKPCRPLAIREPPAGKGSPHDSAWIVLLCARGPLNLSKASRFGSTLAGGRPLRVCASGVRCALGFAARRFFGSGVPLGFLGGMLSFFPPECVKYSRSGYLGEHLQTDWHRLRRNELAKAQVAHCKHRANEGQHHLNLPRTGIFCIFAPIFRQDARVSTFFQE